MMSATSRYRQGGWSAAEYLAILAGLMIIWRGAQGVLELVREHYEEYCWVMMLPI